MTLTSALWKIARDMTEENLEEAMEGLEYEVEGTFLEDLDELDHTDRGSGITAKQYLLFLVTPLWS